MESVIDETSNKQLHKMSQDLANFIALYEHSEGNFKKRKEEMDQQVASIKHEVEAQLNEIRKALNEMNEVMSAAGAARWRMAAEKAMKQGDEHLVAIKEACNVYKKLSEDSVTRLEHVSVITEKRISGALHHLNEENASVVEGFRTRAQIAFQELENTASNSIESIKRLLRWIKFDRIGTAVIAALLSAFLMSLYVNAEWPWESYKASQQERLIGKSVLAVWPTLSASKQKEINQLLGQNIQ